MNSPTVHQLQFLWSKWDAFLTESTLSIFDWLGWQEIYYPAETTKHLPFVKTPTALVTCILGYLFIIGAAFLKRSLSSGKSKSNGTLKADSIALRVFMFIHNLFLVILSGFMFAGTVHQAVTNGYTLWGNMLKVEETGMATMLYIFYLSKIYEFNDTFIMLMKGNFHQVSFLHVYHHVSISFVWWFLVYCCPGGDAYYTAALNSFVHIFMYTYYLLSLIVGKDSKKRKKWLWWGRYMTLFQMAQFVSMMCQAIYCYFFTEFPRFLSVMLFVYMQTLLLLFGNFYLRKHVFGGKKKKVQ
eukprot:g7937.t1